jgi:hypothetical protein
MERIKQAVAHARRDRDRVVALRAAEGETPASKEPLAGGTRRGLLGGLAIVAGGLGLLAGIGALWLTLAGRTEQGRGADPQSPVPIDGRVMDQGSGAVRELESVLAALRQQTAALEAANRDNAQSVEGQSAAFHARIAELEAEIAALKRKDPTPPAGPASAAATRETVVSADALRAEPRRPEAVSASPPPASLDPGIRPSGGAPLPPGGAGAWAVVVQSFASEAEAGRRQAQVAALGLPVEVRPATVKGQRWHRVLVPGYPTLEAARNAAADLGRRQLGEPWVLSLGAP